MRPVKSRTSQGMIKELIVSALIYNRLIVDPDRPDWHERRAIKDRQDTYAKISRPRNQMRKALRRQKVEA